MFEHRVENNILNYVTRLELCLIYLGFDSANGELFYDSKINFHISNNLSLCLGLFYCL